MLKKSSFTLIVVLLLWIYPNTAFANPDTASIESITKMQPHWSDQAKSILSDQRFNYPDHWAWWWQLVERLGQFFQWIKPKSAPLRFEWLQPFFKPLLIGLLATLPFLFIWQILKLFHINTRYRIKAGVSAPIRSSPSQLRQTATQLAAEGDFREAIRFLYLSSLELFRNEGVLAEGIRFFDRDNLKIIGKSYGLTSQSYLAFSQLVLTFQEKWYGYKNCTAADYDRALKQLELLSIPTGKANAKI